MTAHDNLIYREAAASSHTTASSSSLYRFTATESIANRRVLDCRLRYPSIKAPLYLTILIWLTVLLFQLPNRALAQLITGSITGTVVDNTGAVIPSATLILTNEGTGTSVTVYSGAAGSYAIEAVNPGKYVLHITKPGFAEQISKGIQVHVQENVSVNVKLSPGGRGSNSNSDCWRHASLAGGGCLGRPDHRRRICE